MELLRIARAVEIAEVGTVAFFENEPEADWPWCEHIVRVSAPGEMPFETRAKVEFASSSSLGEVMILIFQDIKQDQLKPGFQVEAVRYISNQSPPPFYR